MFVCLQLLFQVRSCENLQADIISEGESSMQASFKPYYLNKSSSMKISHSQTDVRRGDIEISCEELCQSDKNMDQYKTEFLVPSFITSCINFLEKYGLQNVGLFRISTSKKRIKAVGIFKNIQRTNIKNVLLQIREGFEKCDIYKIPNETCPQDVATLLKEFLRDLSDPLMCSSLYKSFVETQSR